MYEPYPKPFNIRILTALVRILTALARGQGGIPPLTHS